MIKRKNRFLEYLLSKYENKFMDDVLGFATHNYSLLKEYLNDDRMFISEVEVYDSNPITVYIEQKGDDVIEFDVVFNPTYECYCGYGRHHDYETEHISDIWLSISGRCTLSKRLSDIKFGWCKVYDKSKQNKPLEGNLIPLIYRKDYDSVASELLSRYYKKNGRAGNSIDVASLAKNMGINLMYHAISEDGKSFGRVVFDEVDCTLYDDEIGQSVQVRVPSNTIIIDRKAASLFSLGSEKITIAHEIVHYYLHRSAFLFAKILNQNLTQLECKNGGVISDEDDPMKWFEIQANGIAPCIAMPKDDFISKYKEYESIYSANAGSYVDAVESIINALADFFGVTRYSVKKRLIDLGIETAHGAFNYVDGHYVRPYTFKKGALAHDETFTISFADFSNLMDNINHLVYFYRGEYAFVENHVCLNSEKYIERDAFGHEALTAYARTHIDECCVKFKCKSQNELIANSTFNTFCYLCRDAFEDISTIIDFSADNQVLFKDADLIEKISKQTATVNEIKKKIAGCNLTETLNALKEIFQWKNLGMALDIGVDEKTIERYLNGKVKNPSRGVIIAMCLAMKLTPDLISEVLSNAGLSISSTTVEGRVLMGIITTCKNKSISDINDMLRKLNIDPLT